MKKINVMVFARAKSGQCLAQKLSGSFIYDALNSLEERQDIISKDIIDSIWYDLHKDNTVTNLEAHNWVTIGE